MRIHNVLCFTVEIKLPASQTETEYTFQKSAQKTYPDNRAGAAEESPGGDSL